MSARGVKEARVSVIIPETVLESDVPFNAMVDPLERGYAIVFDDAGRVLRSVAAAQPGDRLTARLADGELRVKVRDD